MLLKVGRYQFLINPRIEFISGVSSLPDIAQLHIVLAEVTVGGVTVF